VPAMGTVKKDALLLLPSLFCTLPAFLFVFSLFFFFFFFLPFTLTPNALHFILPSLAPPHSQINVGAHG